MNVLHGYLFSQVTISQKVSYLSPNFLTYNERLLKPKNIWHLRATKGT